MTDPKVLLKDIVIDSENKAITVMAGMLEVAQSRGVFNMEESSKIWECIKKFHRKPAQGALPGAVEGAVEEGADGEKANNVMIDINEK
jgi:hypothetical protein|tara:strand:- start:556 stop:819 length:264 start_codon:yes stop_codon:yes gene_type:complete